MIAVETHEGGALVRVVLDRPKGNILDRAMIGAIARAVRTDVGPRAKLLVLEGAGANFSFGASVEEHRREHARAMLDAFHGLFRELLQVAVPTCAVVRGHCLGGGLELASFCTYVVATPDARFGQPEIALAVFPPMASILLPWRVGGGAALDLCVSGRSIDAEGARRLGLVAAVTDDPDSYVNALYTECFAPRSAVALRFAERAVRTELTLRIERDLPALERLYLDEVMATHDANESIAAFVERRTPRLQNA